MSLPELTGTPPAPSDWARKVPRDQPHGLDLLEAHVLAYATEADALAKTPKWKIAWNVSPMLGLLASIGGFAAVFGSPRDVAIGRVDAPDAADIPFAALSFAVAIVGVIVILIFWITQGRRRNGALQIVLGLITGFGVAGVLVAHNLVPDDSDGVNRLMIPAYIMMALAVVGIVLIQLSPPQDPEPELARVPVGDLGEKAMKYLMKERADAIDILAERRMLPDADVRKLKERPLGRLHVEENA